MEINTETNGVLNLEIIQNLSDEEKEEIAKLLNYKSDNVLEKQGASTTRKKLVEKWLATGDTFTYGHKILRVYQYLESIGVVFNNPYIDSAQQTCSHERIGQNYGLTQYCMDCGEEF